MTTRVALVPGVLALLPEYAGLTDPVADLRAACLDAVGWLLDAGDVTIVAAPQGERVARSLVEAAGRLSSRGPAAASHGTAYLVVGNGSARRTEKAPGHLDERAHAFDAGLDAALRSPDREALRDLDLALADDLLADARHLPALGELLADAAAADVDYADDPFGVQYWVMRWTCGS